MKFKYIFIVITCLIIDQAHKFYMVDIFNMPAKGVIKITEFLNFVMVWNRGVSFGMFQGHEYSNIFFFIFSTVIICFIFYMIKISKLEKEKLFLSIIAGGAIGNLIDRVRFGAVADFFDFHYAGYHWPAFNFADSFVFIGATGLIIVTIFFNKGEKGNV